jgi:RNA polymerase sigma-70 factor (ECF subfamily)
MVANVESFDAFYVGTRRRIFGYAYALTGDLGDGQDLAQEAYTRAWRHWRTVERHPNPEAWMRTVVWRLAAKRWRRQQWLDLLPTFFDRAAEEGNEKVADRLLLMDALQRLPGAQRRVVALRYLYDLSLAQVAQELEVPVGTVKSRLNRGLAALAVALGQSSDAATTGASSAVHQVRGDDD